MGEFGIAHAGPAIWPASTGSYSLSLNTKSFTFFSCFLLVKDFHACQLPGIQALLFIFAQPKPLETPASFCISHCGPGNTKL